MLTYAQVQVAAFTGDGTVYHPHCARELYSELTVSKAEAGLTNSAGLSPMIQYSLDEWVGQDAYQFAEERADDWIAAHPGLAETLGLVNNIGLTNNYYRLIDRLADRYGDTAGPTCDHCGLPVQ